MLLASLSMMPQALGRFGRLSLPHITGAVPNEVLFVPGGMLLLLAAVWVHDLATRGRLHAVTGFGCPFILGMIVLAAVVVPGTTGFKDLIVGLNRPGL